MNLFYDYMWHGKKTNMEKMCGDSYITYFIPIILNYNGKETCKWNTYEKSNIEYLC